MTNMHSDPGRRDVYAADRAGNNTMAWLLGALAIFAVLGVLFWAMSDNNTNTASNPGDTNTGAATRSAPAPAAPAPSGPATPSR